MSRRFALSSSLVVCASLASIAAPRIAHADPLTDEERTQRCADIRDVAADNGISAGYLFTGIAQAETNLSHCWEELDWACQGPASVDCGGGPVVAGAGDGDCVLQQGGLGMFQFDGGTFDDTIQRDGDGVLLLSGNVTRAVDFVVNMVMGSVYVDADVSTPAAAKAWMNSVVVDGPGWTEWVQTVTHYYNGCTPNGCGVYDQRFEHYWEAGVSVYFEQGEDFWVVDIPPCGVIPPEGRLLEETDTCFTKGGPLPYWRVGIGGESNLHVWTGTTDLAESVNYAEWTLDVAEAGDYLVEVSVAGGTTPQARYVVDHAATTTEVIVDQGAGEGFVELGVLPFAAGGEQRVFVGDNTGDLDDRRLGVDAIRLTRIGGGGEGGGPDAGVGSGGDDTTSSLLASSGAAGDGDGDGDDDDVGAGGASGEGGFGEGGGSDAATDGGSGSGCDCATRPGAPVNGAWALALVGAALAFARRRRAS
jgi:MYXO-CTERM domain-containing protein